MSTKGKQDWEELTSYPILMPTMTAFGNKIVSTRGQNTDYSLLNEVQWFVETWCLQYRSSLESYFSKDLNLAKLKNPADKGY